MNKIFKSLIPLLAITLCGCGGNKPSLDKVTDLAFTSIDGEVSWSAVKGIKEYEYTVDDVNILKTSETSINIFDVVKDTNAKYVKVRSSKDNAKSEFETLSFTTKKLATPSKPVAGEDEETHEPLLTWQRVEGASKYLVSVNDKKYVTYHTNVYKPSTVGSYYINVKCKAYVKDKSIVYLESDPSERSDELQFIPGPTLSVDAVNVISWASNEQFDSYNIFINGTKVRENVTSPLNLVTGDNPIITKTGEYDIQIQAIKNGFSYWSNIQKEVGTSNINEGEIYSFDNRKFNRVVPSGIDPGWAISNEKSHSEPYSLYIPTQTQVNLQKYASSGINDIDYRRINKMHYWAYIPAIDGYSGATVKGYNLPPIIYDGWGNQAKHARCVSFAKEKEVPIGEWTKLTFEVENQYDNIIILGAGAKLTLDDGETSLSVPFYLDDLSYDDFESDDLIYDYKFKYDFELCGHSWSNKPQKLSFGSEFANKNVDISMDLCGTASLDGEHNIGFGSYDENLEFKGIYQPIDRTYISSMEYKTYKFNATLDANGDFYTTACESYATADNNETFIIYAKNVSCGESKYSEGTLVEAHANVNATFVSVLPIPTELEAGTSVNISMDIAVHTTGNYSELRTAPHLWATTIPTPNYSLIINNSDLKESDDWRHISFDTRVLDAPEINFHNGNEGYTHSFTGNYILVYLHGHLSTDFFYYKDNSISITAYDSITPAGDNGNSTDRYYQNITGLKTDLSVGSHVTVSMDIYVVGIYNSYSGIYWIDSVYSNNLWNNAPKIVTGEDAEANKGSWYHIEFSAIVHNFASCGRYVAVDTSMYGNAVYLISCQKTIDAFNFRNIEIVKEYDSLISGGARTLANGFYQSMTGLSTNLAEGTSVMVEMDVRVTGSFNEYSSIYVVDSVYSVSGGERNSAKNIKNIIVTEDTGWHHVSFEATIRNFQCLRNNSAYTVTDTSMFGNAVYLLTENNSVDAFDYKNVEFTELKSLIPGGDNGNAQDTYYQSLTGLSTELEVGTSVTVEMDVKVTGTFNSYSHVWRVDSVYTENGGEAKDKTSLDAIILTGEEGWHHITFTATVRSFSHLRRDSAYSIIDTSSFGNAVYLLAMNKTADSFVYKNVSINAI